MYDSNYVLFIALPSMHYTAILNFMVVHFFPDIFFFNTSLQRIDGDLYIQTKQWDFLIININSERY